MKKIKLNLNQRKLISEGLINFSIAVISLGMVSPLLSRAEIDRYLLTTLLFLTIISTVMIFYSFELLKSKI